MNDFVNHQHKNLMTNKITPLEEQTDAALKQAISQLKNAASSQSPQTINRRQNFIENSSASPLRLADLQDQRSKTQLNIVIS